MKIVNFIKEKFNFIKENFIKKFDIILLIYMIINVLYINFGYYFVAINRFTNLKFSYTYFVFLVINILLIKFLVLSKKYRKSKVDILLKLIAIFAIISFVFSYNVHTALYGYFGRNEGLIVILYYLTLVFLSSFIKKEHKKILIYTILFGGLAQSIYAICQRFNLFGIYKMFHSKGSWVYGFVSHPNFFGTLMTICICYAIGLYMDSDKIYKNIIFIILSCFYFIGILLSCTLSALVAFIVVVLFTFIYAFKNKKVKKLILICIILGYILSIAHYFNLTPLVRDLIKTKTETTNIAKGDLNDDYGSGRITVWKKAIKVSPKHALHGVGIDNFAYVLNGKAIQNQNGFFDKAHNEYLQILLTMGICSLISYICLHFIVVKNGIKNVFKNKEIYLLLPVIGYLVQAQFNISVIEVAPFFYIALGFLIDR